MIFTDAAKYEASEFGALLERFSMLASKQFFEFFMKKGLTERTKVAEFEVQQGILSNFCYKVEKA